MSKDILDHQSFRSLNFVGKLTSEELIQEYLMADVFVLPSLSEGFAGVVAEAICAGCPVVVTKECGSTVENEREGFIVPPRDVGFLVYAIKKLVSDREFREKCSQNCILQRGFYSDSEWRQRLVKSLENLFEGNMNQC